MPPELARIERMDHDFVWQELKHIKCAKQHSLDTVDPNGVGCAEQHLPDRTPEKIVNSFNKKLTK
jgi:hypothetical protein